MKLAVVGAGSWGTALAHLLATAGHDVSLWCHSAEVASYINDNHSNPRYLTDAPLPEALHASSRMDECLEEVQAIVVVTPSATLRQVAQSMAPLVAFSVPIVCCSKGVEEGSAALPLDIFSEECGNPTRLAVLSGPNHAEEVIRGIPSGTVIASSSADTASFFQDLFSTDYFRTYTSDDCVGVELCAAAKNVVAIACGISYGLGYGDNTAATLMTRGLAEMSRLVRGMGGQDITCMGLAGMGDLVVTCSSSHSRNRRLGEMLATGKTLDDFVAETHMVAEGALACKTLAPLAQRCKVDMPLADAVRSILWEGSDIALTVEHLLHRPLRQEF